MTKSIKSRLEQLENKERKNEIVVIFQDLDNPDLWYIGGPREGEPVTWDQVLRDYSDYDLIKVEYEKQASQHE
jgi:hypothetical protein